MYSDFVETNADKEKGKVAAVIVLHLNPLCANPSFNNQNKLSVSNSAILWFK